MDSTAYGSFPSGTSEIVKFTDDFILFDSRYAANHLRRDNRRSILHVYLR